MSTILPAGSRTCPVSHASPRELTAHLRATAVESFRPRTPPGPRTPAVLQTLVWMFCPELSVLEGYFRRYGDTFRIDPLLPRSRTDSTRWPLVRAPTYVLSAAEDLKEIFRQPSDVLTGGDVREYLEWYYTGESIITLDGAAHLHERRVSQLILSRDWAERSLGRVRRITQRRLAQLPAHGRIRIGSLLQDLSTRITAGLVFGELSERDAERVCRFVAETQDSISWRALFMLFPALRHDLGANSPGGRMAARFADFRELVTEQVRARRSAPPADDILGRMLALEPDASADTSEHFMRLVGIFGAFDLVAAALCWTAWHLLDDDGLRERVTCEARTDGPIAGSYMEAVCMEALRLHPPFPVAMRRAIRPLNVRGLPIEAGARIAICMHLAHRRPDVFPEPDRFRPERFIEGDYKPNGYVPFGGGSRRCLGYGFATRHTALAIRELLRAFDMRPARRLDPRARRRAIMLLPRDPLLAEIARPDATVEPIAW